MKRRAAVVSVLACVPLALLVALAADDVARVSCFAPGVLRGALGVGLGSATAALVTAVALVLERRSASTRLRGISAAAVAAAASALLFVRIPAPWVDVGPLGAGAVTALGIVVLPLASVVGVLAARLVTRAADDAATDA